MRQSFVSGHGFSRAEPHPKKTWPLGPEAKTETLVEFINEFLIHHTSVVWCGLRKSESSKRGFWRCVEAPEKFRAGRGDPRVPLQPYLPGSVVGGCSMRPARESRKLRRYRGPCTLVTMSAKTWKRASCYGCVNMSEMRWLSRTEVRSAVHK